MARLLFRRKNRILTSTQFRGIFTTAKRLHFGRFAFYVVANNSNIARLGVIVAKRYQKKAVHRNKVKRLIRECFRQQQHLLLGVDVLVMLKQGVETVPAITLRAELCTKMAKLSSWVKK